MKTFFFLLSPPLIFFFTMKPIVTRFIQHLISLTQKEMVIDKESTEKLLSGPADVLEKKGVAILNLKITGT